MRSSRAPQKHVIRFILVSARKTKRNALVQAYVVTELVSLTCLLVSLFQILESGEFNKKVKMSTAKPTEFSCILKVSKQQLGTKPYQVRKVL